MSAITLAEYAKAANDNSFRSGVIELFSEGPLLGRMPVDTIQGNSYSYTLEETLPGVGFRGLNESYENSAGVLNQMSEALRIAGGDLDVDKFLIDTSGEGVRATHIALKVKALRMAIERTIIKGNSLTNPREFDGLQARIPAGTTQYIDAGTNGAALSLFMLDDLIAQVDASDSEKVLVTNQRIALRLSQAARNNSLSGIYQSTLDAFGRQVNTYNGVPIIVLKQDNLGQEILGFNETKGSSNVTTSIYCIQPGDGLCHLIQGGSGIDVRDLGEVPDSPVVRARVDWYLGMVVLHGRSVARLAGVLDSAVVA